MSRSAAFFLHNVKMYILYIDDSGSIRNPNEQHFVLGGVAVFEKSIYHIIKHCDVEIDKFDLGLNDDIELHATDMYGGRNFPWKAIKSKTDREKMIGKIIGVIKSQRVANLTLFSVTVDKRGISPRDPIEMAFEEICNRFNLFLQRTHARTGHNNRGLIVMDESRHEKPLQALARNFRVNGGRWGQFRYLAEVPLFIDSKASRLIQLADLVAWSTFRKYEYKDGRFFDELIEKYDSDGGVFHGLCHLRGADRGERCICPACLTRENRNAAK
tara:strand:+ start:378 stop:1190 length:813 start_codon:yes stop_codon:yes gene_type:complete